MICPGCGHKNKPGITHCEMCTAPLSNIKIVKNIPKNALLDTTKKSRVCFLICVVILSIFCYYISCFIYRLQSALNEEETSNITYRLLQRNAQIKNLSKY